MFSDNQIAGISAALIVVGGVSMEYHFAAGLFAVVVGILGAWNAISS